MTSHVHGQALLGQDKQRSLLRYWCEVSKRIRCYVACHILCDARLLRRPIRGLRVTSKLQGATILYRVKDMLADQNVLLVCSDYQLLHHRPGLDSAALYHGHA